jgi:hypothetical protein
VFLDVGHSDDRTGMSFTNAAGTRQRSHSRLRVPWDSWSYSTVSDSETSLFVASYDSQGYGGGIRPRLRTDFLIVPTSSRVALYSLRATPQKAVETHLLSDCIANGRGADLEKTNHVIPSQWLHWCADSCLRTSNKHSFTETPLLLLRVLTCLLGRYLAMLWPSTLRHVYLVLQSFLWNSVW